MLTVLAARKPGGVFSPAPRQESRGDAEIYYLKNLRSLKRLQKKGVTRAALAPSLHGAAGERASAYVPEGTEAIGRLPHILRGLASLPVGELYLSMAPERAAEIIGLCSDCAKLFSVITRETGKQEVFDRLYFDRGIILRRLSTPASRIGATALCVTEDGRTPPGVMSVDLRRIDRLKFYGGPLDFLEEELGLSPTAELYAFAGLPLPRRGKISKDHGDKILYLDIGTNLM